LPYQGRGVLNGLVVAPQRSKARYPIVETKGVTALAALRAYYEPDVMEAIMITITCPKCGKQGNVDEGFLGKTARCNG